MPRKIFLEQHGADPNQDQVCFGEQRTLDLVLQ